MQNWLLRGMEVVDAFSNVKCELLSVVPGHFNLHVVKQAPERATCTVLEYNAQVRLLCTSAEEKYDVWVSNDLHDCTFVLKLFKFVLLDDLPFNFFNRDNCVLPTSAIDDTIATLRKLSVVAQLIEADLVVLNESACFV